MQSLEAACEEGERAHKRLKTSHTSLPLPRLQDIEAAEGASTSYTSKNSFNITSKLAKLYEEENARDPNRSVTGIKKASFLLEKLVVRERLNTMILNLYAGKNKGYSLVFRRTSRMDQSIEDTANMIEMKECPYEEEMLLSYIKNEQLPPHLIDKLQANYSFLFYNGCVICEVRNYRQIFPEPKCYVHHVLLKPTQQSIWADIEIIARDKRDWGKEEKALLESLILKARTPKLCLELDDSLCEKQSRISHNRHLFNTRRLSRVSKQYSINVKKKQDHYTNKYGLELFNYIVWNKLKTAQSSGTTSMKIAKKLHEEIKPIPVPNLDVPLLTPPSGDINITQFKAYQRPEVTSDSLPQLVEEYVLETDIPLNKGNKRLYHIKLSILQRPSNSEYLGELYLEWDHKQNTEQNGVACRFSLGSKAHANKYIQQFTDIFTDNFRKRVKIKHRSSSIYKEKIATQLQATQLHSPNVSQVNLAHQHLQQLSQTQPCITPLLNGTIGSGINMIQPNQTVQNTTNVPILHAQLQGNVQPKPVQKYLPKEAMEINAIANKIKVASQQFQAAANAKQQQQQRLAAGNKAAIINVLNSPPVSNINNDANVAVVNAINNTSLLPQVALNQKLLARKMTVSNVMNARVLNPNNLIAVNNNRISVSDFNAHPNQLQSQTITLNSGGSFSNANFANVLSGSSNDKSTLSALLVGTASADRPDIANTNSLLVESLTGGSNQAQSPTHFIQSPKSGQQYTLQSSPKNNPAVSPLSSPPLQNANTINVQSLNFTPIQGLQVQLPGYSIALSVPSSGGLQGHPTSLIVSLPVTSATATCTTVSQQANNTVTAGSSVGMGAPTVVFGNSGSANIAHLVTGVKGLSQQNIRTAGPASVTMSQSGQQLQLVTPMQRPKLQQGNIQQNIATRGIQRTPITIKMASPNATAAQVTLPANSSMNSLSSQLQKQAQLQQYQQLYFSQQQKGVSTNIAGKVRRRSNTADPQ